MKYNFSGVITAIVTPFKNGGIDFPSLKKLIAFQLQNKIEGLVVAGSTGEAATLSLDEKTELLEFVIKEVGGQVPVIMGSGTFNTSESCDLAKHFQKTGADALLVVTPYYSRPPQRGLIAHYKKICESTSLPIIAYNVPSRTAMTIEVPTILELAKTCKNIVAIKEAAGKLDVIKEMRKNLPKEFVITSGDDLTFVEAMGLGAQGVISVISNVVPKHCLDAAKSDLAPKTIQAHTENLREISTVLFCESNPIPVKWALYKMGILEKPEVRLPLVELAPQYYGEVEASLKRLGAL